MRIERRLYKNVAPSTIEVDQYVVPDGSRLCLESVGGNAAGSSSVRIVWDYGGANTVLMSTHGDTLQHPHDLVCVGDGEKILAIVLDNDSQSSAHIGAFWMGAD